MKRKNLIFIIPAAVIAIALFMAFGGWVVMSLWNWLLPGLFSWRMISFWQAMGMLVLCRILFGGVSGRGWHRRHSGRRMGGRWSTMTSEEREKLRRGMRERCGFGPPAAGEYEA